MTEQEAATKWCPHMPYCVNPHQVAVVSAAEYKQTRCCASDCMMWRWDRPPVLKKTIYQHLEYVRGHAISRPSLSRSATDAEWDAAWTEVEDKCRRLGVEIGAPDGWEPDGDDGTVFEPEGDNRPYWYRDFKRRSDPDASGYCGLAGKP